MGWYLCGTKIFIFKTLYFLYFMDFKKFDRVFRTSFFKKEDRAISSFTKWLYISEVTDISS